MCSWELNREIGRQLCEDGQMPSILGCAYQRGVPVYVPAFTDSDIALGVSRRSGRKRGLAPSPAV